MPLEGTFFCENFIPKFGVGIYIKPILSPKMPNKAPLSHFPLIFGSICGSTKTFVDRILRFVCLWRIILELVILRRISIGFSQSPLLSPY